MKKFYATILGLLSLVGCTSVTSLPTQIPPGAQQKTIQTGVVGQSYGFRLLGFIPVVNPSQMVARKDIFNQVGATDPNRRYALTNIVEERSGVWLVLFGLPKVTLTADVIEYTQE